MPNGKPIGTPGSSPRIREVQGTLDDALNMLVDLAGNAPQHTGSYKGIGVDLPNGGFAGVRNIMTNSPGTNANLDVKIPGIPIDKIKFNP